MSKVSSSSTKNWFVYMIEANNSKIYTGITTDIERRFREHSRKDSKGKGAKFFRASSPKKILYFETYPNRSLASKRECEIKKMSRKEKLILIGTSEPILK